VLGRNVMQNSVIATATAPHQPMVSWNKGCGSPPRVRPWPRDRVQGIRPVAGFDGNECFCSAWTFVDANATEAVGA
jgi:hypothetical protein